MGELAVTGREPLRKQPFTEWPMAKPEGNAGLEEVLASSLWGGHSATSLRRSLPHTYREVWVVCQHRNCSVQAALKAIDIQPGTR